MTTKGIDIRKLIVTIIMAIIGIIFLLPFIWMISASFKIEEDVLAYPVQWIPQTWNAIENYKGSVDRIDAVPVTLLELYQGNTFNNSYFCYGFIFSGIRLCKNKF